MGEGNIRRVYPIRCEAFDKTWKVTSSPVISTGFRWLESEYIPLSEGAKKEIIMLLIIKDNALIQKFPKSQEALCQDVVNDIEGECELIKSVEELMEYTGKDLATLYNSMSPLKMGDRAKDKDKVAHKIWEMAKAIKIKAPTVVKPVVVKEQKERVIGVKQLIREMLLSGGSYTLADFVEKFGSDKSTSITTALSDLRSEKYCGSGGPLNIIKDSFKAYHIDRRNEA